MKILNAIDVYIKTEFKKDILKSIPVQDKRRFILYGLTCNNKNDSGYSIEVAFKRYDINDNPEVMLISSLGKTLKIISEPSEGSDKALPSSENDSNTLLPAVIMLINHIVQFKKATNNVSEVLLYTIVDENDIIVSGRYINANDDILSIVCDDFRNSNKIKDAS